MNASQTEKAVYLVVTNSKDGRIITALDRKVALVTIKGLAMTNLRDDWFVSLHPPGYRCIRADDL